MDLTHYETRVHVHLLGKTQNISLRDVWISLRDEVRKLLLRNKESGCRPVRDKFFFRQAGAINGRSVPVEFINDTDRVTLTVLLQHMLDFVT